MPKPSIVFFGTGPVSYGTLLGISDAFAIEAVITKPIAISHGKPIDHPVHAWATENNVPVHTPANKRELTELIEAQPFESQVGLVVDYGIIIAEAVIDSFPLGIVNSHFSVLPKYRGADPITPIILEGRDVTGVTLMLIVPELDAGPVLAIETINVPGDITITGLTTKLIELSNKVIQSKLPEYINGSIKPKEQEPTIEPTYTKKLQKADGIIDWSKSAVQIEREIRGYLGWPGSRTTLHDRDVIITKAHVAMPEAGDLAHQCGDGAYLIIDRLKPAGKNEMAAADFQRGLPKIS
jgi:methionyl-tRNA formyltransferase